MTPKEMETAIEASIRRIQQQNSIIERLGLQVEILLDGLNEIGETSNDMRSRMIARRCTVAATV